MARHRAGHCRTWGSVEPHRDRVTLVPAHCASIFHSHPGQRLDAAIDEPMRYGLVGQHLRLAELLLLVTLLALLDDPTHVDHP